LVERRLGVAKPPFRAAGDRQKRVLVHLNLLGLGDHAKPLHEKRHRDAAEVEALAAGNDGRQDLLRLGGGKNEFDVRRRLFEGLEQGVERRLAEHVDFVNDVDLVLAMGRRVLDGLPQVPHLIHAVVRCAVYLQHVEAGAGGNLLARIALVARRDGGAVLAVERLGKDTRHRSLADAAGPDKKIGVAIRPVWIAFLSVRVTWSWPTTSSNCWGRHFLASTSYGMIPLVRHSEFDPPSPDTGGQAGVCCRAFDGLLVPAQGDI